ncbi:hypothetical protein BOTBODRAFT_37076 [Botryobasidium botryosum FD-172 SS1]|uniref:Uncharacterized protein n=1 Tax=Botryobasidium botryosum (strain FD-172 SS1) TaxID=930990 RepID=A0A067M0U2_BOTB1|nr:hypothetical protein BOTBODRAFT_37076 [Botryobasidium botryosum FD-172 SS1]
MATPPVPPRPAESYEQPDSYGYYPRRQQSGGAPPLPPLPPGYQAESNYDLQPHYSDPLVAPRPQKSMSSAPADMTRSLESQVGGTPTFSFPTPNQPVSYGFAVPPPPPPHDPYRRGTSPAPGLPPQSSSYYSIPQPAPFNGQPLNFHPTPHAHRATSPRPLPNPGVRPQSPPWPGASPYLDPSARPQGAGTAYRPQSHYPDNRLSQSFSDLSFSSPPPTETVLPGPPSMSPAPADPNKTPELTVSFPTISSLIAGSQSVASADPARKLAWSKDVLNLVDRTQQASGDATRIADPELARLADTAVQYIQAICSAWSQGAQQPPYIPEALYLRGTLSSSGAYPNQLARDPRAAFKDFESSARMGFHAAWFRLGRDYEAVGDLSRAKDCFERGVRLRDKSCLYRMGMANLLGQLTLPANPAGGLPLLQQAADLADVEVPQPSYVFGMLLLGEFNQIEIPNSILHSTLPPPSAQNPDPRQSEARRRIERAAYLGFPPAQYKCGWSYEHAKMGCPFDPLLSVQYYSLASQQGETEADMALSKWFLVGAEGAFEKDEGLAFTFAEKAAKRGFPNAEFAMGYYFEVGIGTQKDIALAKRWYQQAASHGNTDAPDRLKALAQPTPAMLSRNEHEALTDVTLVRKRTNAKEASAAAGRVAGGNRLSGGKQALAAVNEAAEAAGAGRRPPSQGGPPPGQYPSGPPRRQPSGGPPAPPHGGPGGPGGPGGGQGRHPSGSYPQPQGPGPAGYQGGPPQAHQQQQQRPPRGYSLADQAPPHQHQHQHQRPSPSHHNTAPIKQGGPPGSAGGPPPAASAPPPSAPAPAPASSGPPKKPGPATFADMGIQGTTLEKDDCVIM